MKKSSSYIESPKIISLQNKGITTEQIKRLNELKLINKKVCVILGILHDCESLRSIQEFIKLSEDDAFLKEFCKDYGVEFKDIKETFLELQKKEIIAAKYEQLKIIELVNI